MVFARKCGKRRADAECLRNRQTVFFIVRACRGSVGEGAACGGRAMSCPEPRHAGALHAASASGAVFTPGAERWKGSSPGAGHAQTKRGKLSSVGFRRAEAGRSSIAPGGRVKKSTPRRLLPLLGHTLSRGACQAKPCPLPPAAPVSGPLCPCRQRRSANRSCGAVRQTQGRARRALLSVRTCAASMFDHEKRGRIGHPPPLVVMTDYRTLKS